MQRQLSKTEEAKSISSCSKRWTLVSSDGALAGRCGHCAVVVDSNTMVIFGGGSSTQDEVWSYFNDTWSFNVEENTWRELVVDRSPSPRMDPAAGGWPGHMIIFGGDQDGGSEMFEDTWLLKVDEQSWYNFPGGGTQPRKRHGHYGLTMCNSFLVMGGDQGYARYNPAVFSLDLESGRWSECEAEGRSPFEGAALFAFRAELCTATSFCLFGGMKKHAGLSNELHHAVVERLSSGALRIQWSEVRVSQFSGEPPTARHWHGLGAITETSMVVFGGLAGDTLNDAHVLLLNVESANSVAVTWAAVQESNDERPATRDGFTMVSIPDVSGLGMRFYICAGGVFPTEYFKDVWIFDVDFIGQKLDEVRKAVAGQAAAGVRKLLGAMKFFCEDVIQGVLQMLFLYQFWDELDINSKRFTISSVIAGVACSAMGPINEYLTELRHRDEERKLQAIVNRMREDVSRRKETMAKVVDCPINLAAFAAGEPVEASPIGTRAQAQSAGPQTDSSSAEGYALIDDGFHKALAMPDDIVEFLELRRGIHVCVLFVCMIFWSYVFSLPLWIDAECHGGLPGLHRALIVVLCVVLLCLELWLLGKSRRGVEYLDLHRKQVAFHAVLASMSRYDVFSDVVFVLVSRDCGYNYWPIGTACLIVGVGLMQGLPGLLLMTCRRQWAYAFKFNDFNMLLAAMKHV